MHPDTNRLAAYLDDALPLEERAAVRAHVLGCAACAARLRRLRADATRIQAVLAAAPAPDLRAAVRRRLRRGAPVARAWRLAGVAGVLAALLLAALAGVRGGVFGLPPDRLYVADYAGGRLVALDATSGDTLANLPLGDKPTRLRYDAGDDRLYALVAGGALAVDPRTLAVVARWRAPQPISVNADMALDAVGGRLFVGQPGGVVVLQLPSLAALDTLPAGPSPGALALSDDGRTLLALDVQEATLWEIDINARRATSRLLAPDDVGRQGWLAVADGEAFVLRAGHPPALWRLDPAGDAPAALPDGPPPRDALAIAGGRLAVARGDGRIGGIELVAPDGDVLMRIDPGYDQHRLVAGAGDALYALNWLHGSVTRYSLRQGARVWHIELPGQQPWDGAMVPGGWRLW
jgi:DNA-binding beta-propeller fold protein YncE